MSKNQENNKMNHERYKILDDYSDRPDVLFQDEHLPYILNCENIIDLGCGNGRLVKKLNEVYKKNAVGITYNPQEVKNKLHKNIQLMDMHELDFNDESFDGFVMWDSLEHCSSAYIALCEARRVLKENGKGLIFMPGQNWLDCHVHICCYTVKQMLQLFKQAKLELVNVYEKKYIQDENRYCEGMAIYEVRKNSNYNPKFMC
jgi:ubiquinone/menaquinone biosynthesis C-methylase UbiE